MQIEDLIRSAGLFVFSAGLFSALFLGVLKLTKKNKYTNAFIAGYIFVFVFLLRLFVNLNGGIIEENGFSCADMSVCEKIIDSIIHTLQTFSMDESYTEYINSGKEYIGNVYLSELYGYLASILNVAAPLSGGALIIDILTKNIFPELNILIHPKRVKYVFSELNEQSICLAEDIARKKDEVNTDENTKNALIIFVSTKTSEDPDDDSDLMVRAKKIGAVCVKKDISSISFKHSKNVNYLLINDDAQKNIAYFSDLMKKSRNMPYFRTQLESIELTVTSDKRFENFDENAFFQNTTFWVSTIDIVDQKEKRELYIIKEGGSSEAISAKDFNSGKIIKNATVDPKDTRRLTISFRPDNGCFDIKKPFTISFGNRQKALGLDDDAIVDIDTNAPEPLTKVFMFVQNDYQSDVVGNIMRKNADAAYKILLRVIRDYKNTAFNLMRDIPLYLPLIDENGKRKNDLNIAVIGGGQLAQEIFKTVYWCGQMNDVDLRVKVVCSDKAQFESDISESCPEMLESCLKDSPLLRIFPADPDSALNPPYINNVYEDRNESSEDSKNEDKKKNYHIVEETEDLRIISNWEEVFRTTDYFIIAPDSDDISLEITEKLNAALQREFYDKGINRRAVIAPAISHSATAEAITRKSPDFMKGEPYILPFAHLKKRFSYSNVFMENSKDTASKNAKAYSRSNMTDMLRDEYASWSNIARAIHAPYKLFGLGLLKVKSGSSSAEDIVHTESLTGSIEGHEKQLAWLEHRRWTAFLRSQGFSCPTEEEFQKYYTILGSHKNLPLKLHRCITESFIGGSPKTGKIPRTDKKLDGLDIATFDRCVAKERYDSGSPDKPAEEITIDWGYFKNNDKPERDEGLKIIQNLKEFTVEGS